MKLPENRGLSPITLGIDLIVIGMPTIERPMYLYFDAEDGSGIRQVTYQEWAKLAFDTSWIISRAMIRHMHLVPAETNGTELAQNIIKAPVIAELLSLAALLGVYACYPATLLPNTKGVEKFISVFLQSAKESFKTIRADNDENPLTDELLEMLVRHVYGAMLVFGSDYAAVKFKADELSNSQSLEFPSRLISEITAHYQSATKTTSTLSKWEHETLRQEILDTAIAVNKRLTSIQNVRLAP